MPPTIPINHYRIQWSSNTCLNTSPILKYSAFNEVQHHVTSTPIWMYRAKRKKQNPRLSMKRATISFQLNVLPKPHIKAQSIERTNQKNSGLTSVDRSTKATLSTYNTWIQVSRLQKIYHFQRKKLWFATVLLTAVMASTQEGRDLTVVLSQKKWWTTLLSQHGFRLRGVQS